MDSDDGSMLYIDGRLLINHGGAIHILVSAFRPFLAWSRRFARYKLAAKAGSPQSPDGTRANLHVVMRTSAAWHTELLSIVLCLAVRAP